MQAFALLSAPLSSSLATTAAYTYGHLTIFGNGTTDGKVGKLIKRDGNNTRTRTGNHQIGCLLFSPHSPLDSSQLLYWYE